VMIATGCDAVATSGTGPTGPGCAAPLIRLSG
jgi:hypothetical protein